MQNMKVALDNIANTNKENISKAQNAVVSGQPSSVPTPNSPQQVVVSGSSGSGNNDGGGNKNKSSTKYALVNRSMGLAIMGNLSKTDAELKARNHPDCAIVSMDDIENGRWVRNRYASGTSHAKKGLGIWGEAGNEIMIAKDGSILLSSGATLYPY